MFCCNDQPTEHGFSVIIEREGTECWFGVNIYQRRRNTREISNICFLILSIIPCSIATENSADMALKNSPCYQVMPAQLSHLTGSLVQLRNLDLVCSLIQNLTHTIIFCSYLDDLNDASLYLNYLSVALSLDV